MIRLFSIIYSMAGTTGAGIGVIAALASGYDDLNGVLVGAIAGAVIALPATYVVTKKLMGN